jgi:hypothetical protein
LKSIKRIGLLGAFIALVATLGVATNSRLTPTASAVPPTPGLTLTLGAGCTATVAINASTSCVVTIANPTAGALSLPAGAVVLSFAPANGAGATGWGQVQIASVGAGGSGAAAAGGIVDISSVTVVNAIGGTQTLTVTCDGGTCDLAAGASLVMTASLKGAVGGPVTGTITYPGGTTDPAGTITVSPATTFIQPNVAPPGSAVACAPNTVVNVGSGAAGSINCQIDLDDNDLFDGDSVSSGNVTVTASGPAGLAISAAGFINITPTSIQGRCGTANLPQGCGFVTVNISSATGSTVTGPVSISIAYTPDLPLVNTALTQTIANAANIIQPVAAFVAPTAITIACGTPATLVITPGAIAALPGTPIAVGILPRTLGCTVTPTPAAVAAGTIEVSSVNGTLLDANGRLTTNLRIACGDPTIITLNLGTAIDPNTCQGVRFGVVGFGVGQVELRARYEPSNAASQAGVQERETAANVFFIAPNPCEGTTGCSLLLNPNPVNVGATGIATMRFGRSMVECGVAIVGGISLPCVDPTTGLPLLLNFGSILNGNVVFTIADSLVASWVGAQPTATTPAPSSAGGFTTTANTTIVRCGFFPTLAIPGVGSSPFAGGQPPLAQFFGGCEDARATYRGNNPGITSVSASFIPDLPGATGLLSALPPANFPQASTFTSNRALEVIGLAPVGDIQLARGCNNVSPTVTEAAAAYAARVNPSGALVAIWEHQAATNTFRGWSPAAGAPNDLQGVTRLRPVFVCTSGAATLAQPPA